MPDDKIYTEAELQNAIKERVRTIEKERDDALKKVREFEPQVQQVTTLTQERDQARQDLAHERSASATFRAAASAGILDPERVAALEFLHGRAMATVAEKDRVPFDKWIAEGGPGRTHAAASLFFTAPAPPAAPPGTPPGTPPAAPPSTPPGTPPAGLPQSPGTPPGTPPKTLDARRAEVQTFLKSPEYLKLPPKEQREKYTALMAELNALKGAGQAA
jgi:hypothetical protein